MFLMIHPNKYLKKHFYKIFFTSKLNYTEPNQFLGSLLILNQQNRKQISSSNLEIIEKRLIR